MGLGTRKFTLCATGTDLNLLNLELGKKGFAGIRKGVAFFSSKRTKPTCGGFSHTAIKVVLSGIQGRVACLVVGSKMQC